MASSRPNSAAPSKRGAKDASAQNEANVKVILRCRCVTTPSSFGPTPIRATENNSRPDPMTRPWTDFAPRIAPIHRPDPSPDTQYVDP